jgi:hypothetical protein
MQTAAILPPVGNRGIREERALTSGISLSYPEDLAAAVPTVTLLAFPDTGPLHVAAVFPWEDDAIYVFCLSNGSEALLLPPTPLVEVLLFLPLVALRFLKGSSEFASVTPSDWEEMITAAEEPFSACVSSIPCVEEDSASLVGCADSVLESDCGLVLSDEESDYDDDEPTIAAVNNSCYRDDNALQSDKEIYSSADDGEDISD